MFIYNLYIPILPDDTAAIFAALLLKSYSSFSSLILSPIVVISFVCFYKNIIKRKGLPHEFLNQLVIDQLRRIFREYYVE